MSRAIMVAFCFFVLELVPHGVNVLGLRENKERFDLILITLLFLRNFNYTK